MFLVGAPLCFLVAASALYNDLLAILLDVHQVLPVRHLFILEGGLTLQRTSIDLILGARVALQVF